MFYQLGLGIKQPSNSLGHLIEQSTYFQQHPCRVMPNQPSRQHRLCRTRHEDHGLAAFIFGQTEHFP